MKPKDTEHLHPAIDPKLAAVARSSPVTLAWHDAWSRLGTGSTHEERVKVCQAIRDAGTLPGDVGYFLVSWAAENVAENEDARHEDPLQTLNSFEARRASDRNFAVLLERLGEGPMAALFRTDRGEHDRRREAGRLFFFGTERAEAPVDTGWVRRLVRAVADSIVAREPVGSLAFRHRHDGDFWQVHVCPPASADKAEQQGWAVDLERLREVFARIDGCGWYAAPGEGESPYLWVEGEFDGREVCLRVLPAGEAGKGYQTWRRATR